MIEIGQKFIWVASNKIFTCTGVFPSQDTFKGVSNGQYGPELLFNGYEILDGSLIVLPKLEEAPTAKWQIYYPGADNWTPAEKPQVLEWLNECTFKECVHVWATYDSGWNRYDYCSKCDIKKN